jgi:hypothetical protein
MNRHTLAASVALAVLVTLGVNGTVSAAEPARLRGQLSGFTDATGFPLATVSATGNATLVGSFALVMPHVVDPETRIATGTFEIVAANGDKLVGTMVGRATPTGTLNVLQIVEILTITGGTGRFEGATGSLRIDRTYFRAPGATSGTTSGTIAGTVSAPGIGW